MPDSLPTLSRDQIASLLRRRTAGESGLERDVSWLDVVDSGPTANTAVPTSLRVAAFNAERGTHFDAIVTLLRDHPRLRGTDIVLLSEVDWGMARSANRHVARELAAGLGMAYAFGTEFLELTKGDAREAAASGENAKSLHGNAIVSRFPLLDLRIVRLPVKCAWDQPEQARIGGRMAIIGDIQTAAGRLTLASIHFENRTSPDGRREQMAAAIDALANSPRAVVGGDLNTATIDPDKPEQLFSLPDLLREDPKRLVRPQPYEPLFEEMRAAGFLIEDVNEANVPTCVPWDIQDPAYWLKLDWLFTRGVRVSGTPVVVPATNADGRVSDHDFVVVDVETGA